MSTLKSSIKPLKGETTTLTADTAYQSIDGVPTTTISSTELQSVAIINSIIRDSEINNTIIGYLIPNSGYFTDLYSSGVVRFSSYTPDSYIIFDPIESIFKLNNVDLHVTGGCSYLGNIEICNNTIKNTKGSINIISSSNGSINLIGPVNTTITQGNLSTTVTNGNAIFNVGQTIGLTSNSLQIKANDANLNINSDFNLNASNVNISNVKLTSSLEYTFERYTLSSLGTQYRNPSVDRVVSMFSVSGSNYITSSGTMPSLSIQDGTFKILVCSSMGLGCQHTIYFGENKLIAPNPLNQTAQPTKIVFKRQGQSVQLIYDAEGDSGTGAWVVLTGGVYIT
jgi:hypothetical protein